MQDIVSAEGVEITPAVKEEIWGGLKNLAAGPREQRTLTLLAATVQNQTVKSALLPYTLDGPHGHLLDAQDNSRITARWQTFEMSELMGAKAALQPVLTYIFRTLEQRFDGRPTLLVLDEAWLFLDQGSFAAKIREWLKTLRKFNVAVVFATQSLADIARSSIAPALIESCPTRIFLPNPDAYTPQISELYAAFGLNAQQLRIIASASQIAYGQERALIAWNRIVMPNGRSINIGAMEGADLTGASGLHDQVDGHFWQLARGILLSTVFSVGAASAQDAGTRSSGGLVLNSAGSGISNEATQVGQQITSRDLNRQPTIKVRAGWPLRVLVNKDMILAPYP